MKKKKPSVGVSPSPTAVASSSSAWSSVNDNESTTAEEGQLWTTVDAAWKKLHMGSCEPSAREQQLATNVVGGGGGAVSTEPHSS